MTGMGTRPDLQRRHQAELESLLSGLDPEASRVVASQVDHFTRHEAERRDEIVLGYFGKDGVESIVDAVAGRVTANCETLSPALLDVGAGVGTFTVPLFEKLREKLPGARFYATDPTPAMLQVLSARAPWIETFVGVAEDLKGSVAGSNRRRKMGQTTPMKFDATVSTLMLHHCPDMRRVFSSMAEALNPDGTAVIVDLCEHPFTEFREEMGDLHLGFDPGRVRASALESFGTASVSKMTPACKCSDSGRTAELFMLVARK